jgi:hypothetical protein
VVSQTVHRKEDPLVEAHCALAVLSHLDDFMICLLRLLPRAVRPAASHSSRSAGPCTRDGWPVSRQSLARLGTIDHRHEPGLGAVISVHAYPPRNGVSVCISPAN